MQKLFLFTLLLTPFALQAQEPLPLPTGEVILEVSGAISRTNIDDEAHFDRAMIDALPSGKIVTSNHVLDKPATYTGPVLSTLLKQLGAKGNSVLVTALDDYTAELSMTDIEKYGVILATHENGKVMTIDTRGPFFVVFPFDQYKKLKQDLYYNMSVWQINAIEVE